MAVITLLATLMGPALRGPLDGYHLSGAANTLESTLSLARQTAMTRNLPVEVRIYQYKEGTIEGWRLLGTVIPAGASGKAHDEWLGELLPLAGNVVIDEGAKFSTVISKAANSAGDPRVAPWKADEATSAPEAVRSKPYVAFRYNPDGSTDLPSTEPWCLSLRNWNAKPSQNGPADNFISLVIDAHTGRTLKYQP
jgi:uncharacterized protein (TIGR02596 family)